MTINCRGRLIDLSTPRVMGILNLTPDSFYDGGKYKTDSEILNQVEKLITEGATFIDVGTYSSRPGAKFVSENEEEKRLLPALELILKEYPECIISVDTFRSGVAKQSVQAGACIINDITGGLGDTEMMQTVATLKVPYIIMHMRGEIETKEQYTQYVDLKKEILLYFSERLNLAKQFGITHTIIDLGFGFSKTLQQNYELAAHLELFKTILEQPLLVGVSRKSMFYKLLDTTAKEALHATTAMHAILLQKGANILRVHDVKEAMETIKVFQMVSSQKETHSP